MTKAASDEELVRRIGARDSAALQMLFARHQVRVYRFILRMIRNEARAEELVNEVFLEIWRHAGRFAGRSTASTWMLSIARNKTISVLRKRSDAELDDAASEMIEDTGDTPEVTALKQDKGKIMRACINRLSAEHREVIDLVYYHEKSIREVAEIIGKPENTVKTRMFHARKNLSGLLRSSGIDRGWP